MFTPISSKSNLLTFRNIPFNTMDILDNLRILPTISQEKCNCHTLLLFITLFNRTSLFPKQKFVTQIVYVQLIDLSPEFFLLNITRKQIRNDENYSNQINCLIQILFIHKNRPEKECLGKIDYFLGEHRQINFEVNDESDRYSVRIGAYFLNEWFGVISIENESFHERYVKQKQQFQSLNRQINQNYEYLLHCARQNIENTKELYQKIQQQQNGLQQKGELKVKQKGQIQSENNLGSYNIDRSLVIDTENTLNEPIKECSSYLENKSPIAANVRRNNHQNHSQPHKSSLGEVTEIIKQKSLQRNPQNPPPTFGSEGFHNNLKINLGDQNNLFSNNLHEQNLDMSSKNMNISLFIKKNNNKSSVLMNENQNIISNNNNNNNNNYQMFNEWNNSTNNNNNNVLQIANQPNNKGLRLDIDALNETCNTPISTKIVNNPFKQLINQISESTKAMYTALLLKTALQNMILPTSKPKKQNPTLAELEYQKNIKKANLKQVVSNIAGLFKYYLNDRGSDIIVKYDENIPHLINQDQSKFSQLLFNCLNLMVVNIVPSHQLYVNVSNESNQYESLQANSDQNNNFNVFDQQNNNKQSHIINMGAATTTLQAENSNIGEKLKQQQQQLMMESETDKVLKIVIKAKLQDGVTCSVPKFKDMKMSILEHGFEQVFAKYAIPASQKIIKDIGPYSKIKFQFDPSDCTFLMSFCIYSDLGVLNKRRSLYKMHKRSVNNAININPVPISAQIFTNNIIFNHSPPNRNSIQMNRDRIESQLAKSYNIMNVSEEKFLRAKDDNFNKITAKQVNCRTIQRLETTTIPNHQQSETIQQLRTNNILLHSPMHNIDQSTHQRILLPQNNPQDKQFQEILKKQNSIVHQSSRQLFNPGASLGLFEGNTQPSYIMHKGKQQEMNSSQEISQNQQRSMLQHNSVSNIIQQHTNITID